MASSKYARVILAVVVFVVLLAQVLLYPGIDTLVAALGATTRVNASMWFLAAEFAAFVAFAGVWGAASDATGRRVPFVAAGAFGGAIGYWLIAFAGAWLTVPFAVIVGLRVVQGAATIGAFSLAMTMLMDLSGGHGRNMGAAGIAIGLGTALGAPLGGQLYAFGPFTPLYVAGAILVGAAVLTVWVDDRAPSVVRTRITAVLKGMRETPALGLPYAFGFIDRLTAGFFALAGTLYFRDVFDLDPAATGLTLALFFAPFALLQFPFGVLSDRVGRVIPIVGGSAFYGLAVIGVGIAPTVTLARIGMVVVGVLGALMAPATMALVTDLAANTQRGVAMAGFNVAGSLGFLAGIVIGGTVVGHYSYLAAFVVAGGLETVLAIAAFPLFLRLDPERTATFAR